MVEAERLSYEPNVVVEYTSPDGPRATAMKGLLFPQQFAFLREAGYYDAYSAAIEPQYRETLLHALAQSWIPADAVMAHHRALDAIAMSDAQFARLAEPLGASVYQTVFAALLRFALSMGVDSRIWTVLEQTDRVATRLYRGGGCKVTRVGPKDAHLEVSGLSFAACHSFRAMHCAFVRGVVRLTAKASVVRELPSRHAKGERLIVAISWV